MGKYIYEDKKAWKEQLTKNYKSMVKANKLDWSDEVIEQKVNQKINDPKLVERYQKAISIRERIVKGNKMIEDIKTEYLKTHTEEQWNSLNGYGPFAYCKLDMSGTPEANQKNYEYITKLTDRSFAMKEVMKDFHRLLEADPKKYAFSTPEEGFKIYEENFEFITTCFSMDRMFSTVGNYNFSPEFRDFYMQHKKAIEDLSSCMSMETIYRNPARLVMPEENYEMVSAAMMEYSMNNASLVGQFEGFSYQNGNKMMEASSIETVSEVIKEQTEIEQNYKIFKMFGKEIPSNYLTDYKCFVNDEQTRLSDGTVALAKNTGKVQFIEYTKEEKEAIKNAISHAIQDDIAMKDTRRQLRDIARELEATDHWYNWNNTKEFKNLLTALKEVPDKDSSFNQLDKLRTEVGKVQKVAQAYFDKKNGKTLNENGAKRFEICKRLLDFCDKTMKDDFFHKIVPNADPALQRQQLDMTDELGEHSIIEELDNPFEKSFALEKDSKEEKEFLEELGI